VWSVDEPELEFRALSVSQIEIELDRQRVSVKVQKNMLLLANAKVI